MKLEFSEAHRDLVDSGQTTCEAGYQNVANYAETPSEDPGVVFQQETAEALANLASATEADRTTLQEMALSNSVLTKQLASVTASLQQALKELSALKLADSPRNNNTPTTTRNNNRPIIERTTRKYHNDNYCWSCGFDICDWHNSGTCRWKKKGHNDEATKDDNKGGNQKRRHLVM